MINLMYLVLLAMLALNVSTDVLEGFSLVADGLKKSTDNASKSNMGIYSTFDQQMKNNPAKVKQGHLQHLRPADEEQPCEGKTMVREGTICSWHERLALQSCRGAEGGHRS